MQFLPRIKQATNAVVNITTGGGHGMTLEERLAAPLRASPEMCSLNMGSMNFGLYPMLDRYKEWKYEWEPKHLEMTRDFIFRNTFKDIERILKELGEGHGTRFEFECYDVGHLYNLAHFFDRRLVKPPLFVQTIFGILGGIGADPENLAHMKRIADKLFGDDYAWSILAAGRHQMPLITMGAIMGGNVRVGLEDSLWLGRGQLAKSNAEQVSRIRTILENLSLEIATRTRRGRCSHSRAATRSRSDRGRRNDRQARAQPRRGGRRDQGRCDRAVRRVRRRRASPTRCSRRVLEQGARDLTVVANNAGSGRTGLAALLEAGRVRKIICSYPRSSGSVVFEELYAAGRDRARAGAAGHAQRADALRRGRARRVLLAGRRRDPARRGQGAARDRRPLYVLEKPLKGDVALLKARSRRSLGQSGLPEVGAELQSDDGDGGEHHPWCRCARSSSSARSIPR